MKFLIIHLTRVYFPNKFDHFVGYLPFFFFLFFSLLLLRFYTFFPTSEICVCVFVNQLNRYSLLIEKKNVCNIQNQYRLNECEWNFACVTPNLLFGFHSLHRVCIECMCACMRVSVPCVRTSRKSKRTSV